MNFPTTTIQEPNKEDLFVSAPFSRSNPLYAGLHDIESQLRCLVCHEFAENAVTLLPCCHLFCSLCIRNAIKAKVVGMTRKASCPVCRRECSSDVSKSLVSNTTVQMLIRAYKEIRSDLASQLTIAAGVATQVSNEQEEEEEDSKLPAVDDESGQQQEEGDEQGQAKRRRTSRSSSLATTSAAASLTTTATSKPPPSIQLKPKPTTHYNALKRKDLVALCAQEGLVTKGTDRELKARHEEFVRRYNAECDSCFPIAPAKIARQVNEQEQIRKNFARGSQADAAIMEQLKQNRTAMGNEEETTNGGMVTSGNKEFDAKLKSGFDALIQGMKQRPRKRQWVDTTPENVQKAQQESTQGSTMAQAPATLATSAVNADSEPPSLPPSRQDSNVARAPPVVNPYATSTASARKVARADNKISPTSVSDTKLSTSSKASAPSSATTTTSARKPPQARGLMTSFVTMAPAATSRPTSSSSSQPSTSRSSLIGPWTCHVCTLINTKDKSSRAICEVCGTQRLAPGEDAPPPSKEENNMVLLDV